MNANNLIEAQDLIQQIGDPNLVLVDTRDPVVYAAGHLPGAVNISEIFYYLCTPENGAEVGMAATFTQLFGQAGIRPTDRVVVYEDAMDNGYGKSCRGWLLFKYLGHAAVQVLHGGFRAWKAAGGQLVSGVETRPAVDFEAHVDPDWVVTTAQMHALLADPQVKIVDVRDYAEWLGANSSPYGYDFCPRKGRIPGARWIEWYRMMVRRGGMPWFRTPEEVRQAFAEIGVTPEDDVVLYCFKGARTSNVLLAMKQAGFGRVRNFFGSWNVWSRQSELPIDEGYPE